MKFLRNPEIKWEWGITVVLIFVAAAVQYWFAFSKLGNFFFILFLGLVIMSVHFYFTKKRYQRIAQLSQDIDAILHGKEEINLGDYQEGELSILQNEIKKLFLRLRDQQASLKKDKVYLSDALADISHQLKTPLTSMHLILMFLGEEEVKPKRRFELVQDLNRLLLRLDWLIATLLKLSKLDAGTVFFQRQEVLLQEVVKKALEPLSVPLELKDIQVFLKMDAKASFVGDLSWTVEAVSNIVKNCMEHTPKGGNICIETNENKLYSQLSIRDTGMGIDVLDLPHIFERFYRGQHASDQSIGIGLALSQKIIQQQDGEISARNNTEKGSDFSIRFYKSIV